MRLALSHPFAVSILASVLVLPAAALAAAEAAFDTPMVLLMLFHPRREPPNVRVSGAPISVNAGSVTLAGYWWSPPEKSDTLVLFFHGNAEIAADYEALSAQYTRLKANFAVVDFRGYGRSQGYPTVSTLMTDAEAWLAAVPKIAEERGVEIKRVILMGRSLGSAAAIHAASKRPEAVSGLIIDSGFARGAQLIKRMGGPDLTRNPQVAAVESVEKIKRCAMPTQIIHGANDDLIPVTEGNALYAASAAKKKRILIIPRAGHNNLIQSNARDYFAAVAYLISQAEPVPLTPPSTPAPPPDAH